MNRDYLRRWLIESVSGLFPQSIPIAPLINTMFEKNQHRDIARLVKELLDKERELE